MTCGAVGLIVLAVGPLVREAALILLQQVLEHFFFSLSFLPRRALCYLQCTDVVPILRVDAPESPAAVGQFHASSAVA